MTHWDELTLMRLADRELSPDRARRVRSHLVECAECRWSYEALVQETRLLTSVLVEDEEALPEKFDNRGDLSWLVVAALTLAVVGISTLWNTILSPFLTGLRTVGLDGAGFFTTLIIRGALWSGWSGAIAVLLEGGLLLMICFAMFTFIQWSWRRVKSSSAALALVAVLVGTVMLHPALAGRAEAAVIALDEGRYLLPEGEIVDNDLIVGGREIRIEGVVTGDLIAAGRLVEVIGEVRGDVLAFAQEIRVSGRVGGSVRTGSQTLDIEGMVGRNVTSGGERLRLRPQSAIEGSLIAAFGNARLEAPVERDLTLAAEVGRLDGRVGGALLYAGNELTIGPEAEISGTSKVYGANEPEVSPSARLASPIEFEQLEPEEKQKSRSAWLSSLLFQWAMAFLFGALLMLLAPQTADGIVAHLPRYFWSMFIGLVSAIALFAVAVIALVTVVGIPVGLTGLVVLILAIYSAQVYVASWLGNEVFGPPVTLSQSLGRMALGLAFIQVAEAIPVLGHLVAVLIALWGVGGLALWIHARSPWSRPSVAAPPPEAARA